MSYILPLLSKYCHNMKKIWDAFFLFWIGCNERKTISRYCKIKITESWNFARAKFLARLAENLAKSWNFWAGQGCSAAVHWGRLRRSHSHGGGTPGGRPRPRQPISCLVQGKGKQNKQTENSTADKPHLVRRFMVSVLALYQASKYVFPET